MDTGDSASPQFTLNSLDLDGLPRIAGLDVDMGAYERPDGTSPTLPVLELLITEFNLCGTNGMNRVVDMMCAYTGAEYGVNNAGANWGETLGDLLGNPTIAIRTGFTDFLDGTFWLEVEVPSTATNAFFRAFAD